MLWEPWDGPVVEAERYVFMGITDDVNVCDLCGKSNLKRTVILKGPDGVVHFGSDCAGKALGWGEGSSVRRQVEAKAREAQTEADREAERKRRAALPDTDATKWLRTKADPDIRDALMKGVLYNDTLDAKLRARYAGMKERSGRFPWEPRK